MNRKHSLVVFVVVLALLVSASGATAQAPGPRGVSSPQSSLGTAFTYQGQLKNNGAPVNGNCDMAFGLYDSASGGVLVSGPITPTVTVANGLFTTQLDFGARAFNGDARWLGIQVRCPSGSGSFTPMSAREPLTPAPMALALPGLYTQQNTTSPNVIGGYNGNTMNGGVYGATIGGGGQNGSVNRVAGNFGTVSGGRGNTAANTYATVGGGWSNTASGVGAFVGGGGYNGTTLSGNQALGNASTIGGGLGNTITTTASYASIVGGQSNTASVDHAAVGGGGFNTASGAYATIGGGGSNIASEFLATVGGGDHNTASNVAATVGGGKLNTASGDRAAVSGGDGNTASGAGAFVGGGGFDGTNYYGNQAIGNASTIGGGLGNNIPITGTYATVGGGMSNTATDPYDIVGGGHNNAALPNGYPLCAGYNVVEGGENNIAKGQYNTVSGGTGNTATGGFFIEGSCGDGANFVGGGSSNSATGSSSTVAGGYHNTASGSSSAIPGGSNNTASGTGSFAAGAQAQAITDGTFVWNDGNGSSFASTNNNQFLINAHGGVGILTNTPHDALEVNGYVRIAGLGTAGSTQLCRNASNQIATCSSSLRYKTNVADLALGLDAIAKLRPVTFNWKDSGESDLGFVAEDVNQVAPLLTTLNAQGQIEGVKYDRITAILVKGIQEQQAQIAALQQQNTEQLTQIKALQAQVSQRQPGTSSTVPNAFNVISVIALLGMVGLWWQQRQSRMGGAR